MRKGAEIAALEDVRGTHRGAVAHRRTSHRGARHLIDDLGVDFSRGAGLA